MAIPYIVNYEIKDGLTEFVALESKIVDSAFGFYAEIRNFVVLFFIRPVKKTYNAEFISQICMEHILRRLRYNHTDNANH